MFQLIAGIILFVSIAGITIILYKKAPVLATLPKNGTTGIREHKFITGLESRCKEILAPLTNGTLLHKALSLTKIYVLKIEVKLDHLLHKARKRVQQNKAK